MATESGTKASCWSVTINNPTEDDFRAWNALKGYPWVKEVLGQVEKGEKEETPHIQGMVKTQHVRFSQVKKALPRAHIEKARKEAALAAYVQKDETRVAAIPTSKVATQQDIQKRIMKMTLDKYLSTGGENSKDSFYAWLQIEMVRNRHFSESWLDAAVKALILEGYFGIEFVICNPQVRLAFKKYFSEIIIREYAAQTNSSSESSVDQEQEQGFYGSSTQEYEEGRG